jgi:hypothetical protein
MGRRLTASEKRDRETTGKELQDQIVELAHMLGWKAAHFRAAISGRGKWATPVEYDAEGFPDLILVRERLIAIEVKRETGDKMSERQTLWQGWLEAAGVDFYLARPSNFEEIAAVLMART